MPTGGRAAMRPPRAPRAGLVATREIALVPARPRRAFPDARRSADRLRRSRPGRSAAPSCAGSMSSVVDADRTPISARSCSRSRPRPGVTYRERAEDLEEPRLRAIRSGRGDRRGLYPAGFRAGSAGRPAAANHGLLQHPVHHPRQYRVARLERRHLRCRIAAVAAARCPPAVASAAAHSSSSNMFSPIRRSTMRGFLLRAVHADDIPCGHRDRDRLCDRNGVLAPQPARLAALRRRQPADRPGRASWCRCSRCSSALMGSSCC